MMEKLGGGHERFCVPLHGSISALQGGGGAAFPINKNRSCAKVLLLP